jgi:lysophospholipid acyltransferase (LPLAT)-like uncharacterized protein
MKEEIVVYLQATQDKQLKGEEQCDIITEEKAVIRLWHSKQLISITTIAHATEEWCSHELCVKVSNKSDYQSRPHLQSH